MQQETGRRHEITRLTRKLKRAADVARVQRRHLADAVAHIEYLDSELDDAAATEETYRRALVEVRQIAAGAVEGIDPAALGELLRRIAAVTAGPVDAAQGARGCAHPGQAGNGPCPVCGMHPWSCPCLACQAGAALTVGDAA